MESLAPSEWNSPPSLPGDYTCCDLVVQIKECKKGEATTPEPEPEPAPPEPAPSEEPETPDLREDCSECQQIPASSSLTLQVRPSAGLDLIPAPGDLSWKSGVT